MEGLKMAKKTAKSTAKAEKPWLFKKGQSGNPRGKKPGTLSKATVAMQTLLQGEGEVLTRKCVELALDGDMTAMRLCLERITPPVRELPLEFKLPCINSAEKLSKATARILKEVSLGNLTPGQGESITRLLGHHQKALEISDLDTRLKVLEDALNKGK